MNKYAPLSTLDSKWSLNQIISYLLDNGFVGIENDLPPSNSYRYEIFELREKWSTIKKRINERTES